MAAVKQAIRENDVVEFLHSAGGWPASTSGSVLMNTRFSLWVRGLRGSDSGG
jgi:hypothetical protein